MRSYSITLAKHFIVFLKALSRQNLDLQSTKFAKKKLIELSLTIVYISHHKISYAFLRKSKMFFNQDFASRISKNDYKEPIESISL